MRHALVGLALAGCSLTAIPVATRPTSELRATAPDFTLASQRGEQVALASVRDGHHVAIVFYRGHW